MTTCSFPDPKVVGTRKPGENHETAAKRDFHEDNLRADRAARQRLRGHEEVSHEREGRQ
jgi:hypothetical protein